MNEQAIQEQYQHIVTLLKQQRLKEAQSQLEAFLWNSGDWTLRNRLEQAQTSYQYMLQYMRQGIDDPERQKLYRQILTETWEVADQARLSLLDGVPRTITIPCAITGNASPKNTILPHYRRYWNLSLMTWPFVS